MTTQVRSGGSFLSPETIWIYSNGTWKQVGQLHAFSGGGWVTDGPEPLHQPLLTVSTGSVEQPPQLSLFPPPTGPASPSYRLEEYRYDSLGGNRQLFSTKTGTWTNVGVSTTMDTSPPPGTKLSYELYAVGVDGTTLSEPDVARWQIGTPAVTTEQAVYGWGDLSDWLPPTDHFTISAPTATNSLTPIGFAYDSAGNSTYYENLILGGLSTVALGDGIEYVGNGLDGNGVTYPGTVTMTWVGSNKRRLDEVRVTYRGRVGMVASALSLVSRGRSEWQLTGIPNGALKTAYCDNPDPLGALRYTAGAVSWTGLNRERDSGNTVPIRCVKPPYYGSASGIQYARMAIFDLRIRVRLWGITGYQTVVVTPAVPGAAW